MPLCYRWGNWDLEFCEKLSSLQIQCWAVLETAWSWVSVRFLRRAFGCFNTLIISGLLIHLSHPFIVIIRGLKNLWEKASQILIFSIFFYLKLHDIIMKNILMTMQGSLLPTPLPFCPLHLLSDSCFWKGFRFILEASQTVPSNSEFSAPSTVPGFFFSFPFFFWVTNTERIKTY